MTTKKPVKPSPVTMKQTIHNNKAKKANRAPKQLEDEEGSIDDYGDEYLKSRVMVKPPDQLELTEAELKEEFTRILTANNPHAPDNIVRFSFKEGIFKQISSVEQMMVHFSIEGSLLAVDSDEARRQLAKLDRNKKKDSLDVTEETADIEQVDEDDHTEKSQIEDEEEKVEEAAVVDAEEEKEDPISVPPKKSSLKNRFNFSDRAAQSFYNPSKTRTCQTEAEPQETFSSNANQGDIYGSYFADLENQEKTKEKAQKTLKKDDDKSKKKVVVAEMVTDDVSRVETSAKIIERMVNQNTYDDIAQDFSYFEDASDEFREQEGTLLPLWKFTYEKAKRLTVTALCWNPQYFDLFAVGLGSYDFSKQAKGMILFYSLKNPSFPEFLYSTECGVQCLDIHPEYQHLLCVGLYDGNVAVYNVKIPNQEPFSKSQSAKGKHTDPVWQIKWQKNDLDNNLVFFSISADGRVASWTLLKTELLFKEVTTLNESGQLGQFVDKSQKIRNVGHGTCFDFHRKIENLYIVGTEEGMIHKCSKAYSSRFLGSIKAHHLSVNAVRWNHFHPDIFISCSADWTIKIWDSNYKDQAMFTYDFDCPVGDVAWAPYSSTVFAAVTNYGRVHVFDLNTNKYSAMCQQSVVQKRRTKLTHVEFNQKKMILIVGDDKGGVVSLKLSPNLRKVPKANKGDKNSASIELEAEIAKLDKILDLVREPENKEKKLS